MAKTIKDISETEFAAEMKKLFTHNNSCKREENMNTFARIIGVSKSTIVRYCNGRTAPVPTLRNKILKLASDFFESQTT